MRTAEQIAGTLDTAARAVREYLGGVHDDPEEAELRAVRAVRHAMTVDGHTVAAIAAKAGVRQVLIVRLAPQEDRPSVLATARHDAERYLADVMDEIRQHAVADVSAGMSESQAARVWGVDRATIRSWLGK